MFFQCKYKYYFLKLAISLLTLFFPNFFFSQEQKIIQVKGIITNKNNEVLPYVLIYDKIGKKAYLSNSNGEFNIFVERGTELTFSCMGYKKETYPIPVIGNNKILFLKIKLSFDTILLKEITIFPWKTYQQFLQAVLTTEVPDDDLSRAEKNIIMLKRQMYLIDEDEEFQSPSIAYKISRNQMASDLYWKGQTQPMQIFNIMAWQEFVRYLREGKFKNPNKKNN